MVYTSALLAELAAEESEPSASVGAVQTLCSVLASLELPISPLDAYSIWWPILDRHISFQGEEGGAELLHYLCRDPLAFANAHGLTYASFEPYTVLLWNKLVQRMNSSRSYEQALEVVDREILPRLARLSGTAPRLDQSRCWFQASWPNYGVDNLRQAIEYAETAMT